MNDQTANLILKFVGVFVGFIYAIGFLVVARHLSHYGVSTFSVFQTQYLVAGVWTIAPLIAFVLVVRTADNFREQSYHLRSRQYWKRFVALSAMTGLPFGLFATALASLLPDLKGVSWPFIARLWVSYLLLVLPADLAWMSWRAAGDTTSWWRNRDATPYYLTVFAFGILLWSLNFANSIYPSIPYSLGGGQPRTIVFIPAKDGLPVGILKDNSSGKSVPYKLLEVTDRSYVVVASNPNEVSIEINRDAVQGMIVVKP